MKRLVILVLIVLVLIAGVLIYFEYDYGNKHISIVTPVAYQTFQRSWETNKADLPVVIDATGFGNSATVDVQWLSDQWTSVTLSKTETPCADTSIATFGSSLPCSRYSGFLATLPPGQGTLSLRDGSWWTKVAHPDTPSAIEYVSIGDVFLLGGQSNSVGDGDNFQSYDSSVFKSSNFSRSGQWSELDDKVLTEQKPIATAPLKGSSWPILATMIMEYTGVPVAFIPTGIGARAISFWAPDGELYKFMVEQTQKSGSQPVMLLWMQGESDALAQMPTEDYEKALNDLIQRLDRDLHIRMMIANLGIVRRPQITDINVEHIRDAIQNVWQNNPLVYVGPSFADMALQDNPHFTTDEEVKEFAVRWFEKIKAVGLPPRQN